MGINRDYVYFKKKKKKHKKPCDHFSELLSVEPNSLVVFLRTNLR